jgi:acetyl esterase/lipase
MLASALTRRLRDLALLTWVLGLWGQASAQQIAGRGVPRGRDLRTSESTWRRQPGAARMRNPRQAMPIPDGLEGLRDVVYGTGGSSPLKLDLLLLRTRAATPQPCVVFIHGGGWEAGDKGGGQPLGFELAKRGFVHASINYRLSGEATFPAQIEDCKCAIRFLRAHAREYNIDPTRIGVYGTSAGGHLAALLGVSAGIEQFEGKGGWNDQSSSVVAVVDGFGPADLSLLLQHPGTGGPRQAAGVRPASPAAKLLGGPPEQRGELARLASPVSHVDKSDPPFLIVHGTEDRVVPLRQSQLLHDALRKAGVDSTLEMIEGGGHSLAGPGVNAKIIAFLEKHLGTPGR